MHMSVMLLEYMYEVALSFVAVYYFDVWYESSCRELAGVYINAIIAIDRNIPGMSWDMSM